MNELQIKIQKNSKTMAKILLILCILLVLGLCIPIISLVWISTNPDINLTTEKGIHFYSIAGMVVSTKGEVIAEMCTVILIGIWMLYLFNIAYHMFRAISRVGSPFHKDNASKLKKIGILLFLYAFLVPIARRGFYSSFAPAVDLRISVDAPFVVLALSFYFIAIVFDYGAELQKENDELL